MTDPLAGDRGVVRTKATVLLPTYNEEAEIAQSMSTLDRYLAVELPQYRWEILIVDDGSSDATTRVIEETAPSLAVAVRVIEHVENAGLGQALRTGFANVDGDVIVTMDADLSYDVHHIGQLVRTWETTRAAIVLASPYTSGGKSIAVPRPLHMRSRVANRYLALVSGRRLKTFTGMVRAYDGAFLRNLVLGSDGVVINVELIRKACILGLPVVEIPATLNWSGLESRKGRSRVMSQRAWRETRRTMREGFLFHPRGFLLMPGAFALILGVLLAALGESASSRICFVAAMLLLTVGVFFGFRHRRDFKEFREDFLAAATSHSWPQRAPDRWSEKRRNRRVSAAVATRSRGQSKL